MVCFCRCLAFGNLHIPKRRRECQLVLFLASMSAQTFSVRLSTEITLHTTPIFAWAWPSDFCCSDLEANQINGLAGPTRPRHWKSKPRMKCPPFPYLASCIHRCSCG